MSEIHDGGSIVKVRIPILGGPFLPPEDDALVFKTVPGPDTVSSTSDINQKLERHVEEFLN